MARKRHRRRNWDDDEKREIVAQTFVPGVSVSRVARRYDVNTNLVFTWRRDPRFMPEVQDVPEASFLPVEIVEQVASEPARTNLIETSIDITLANGHRLTIRGAFEVDAIARLARELGA